VLRLQQNSLKWVARGSRALPRLSGRWHLHARGRSKRGAAMTCKIITFEFVVPTAVAALLAITLSIAAVYLTDKYLGPIEQAEAHYSSASATNFAGALACCFQHEGKMNANFPSNSGRSRRRLFL
jgi:hypothetical protein